MSVKFILFAEIHCPLAMIYKDVYTGQDSNILLFPSFFNSVKMSTYN